MIVTHFCDRNGESSQKKTRNVSAISQTKKKTLRAEYSHVILQPEELDVLPESLEGVLAQNRDLVVVDMQGFQLVDPLQGQAREDLDLVPGQCQRGQLG